MQKNIFQQPKIHLKKPLCIGIGGISRSGKTFLADILGNSIAHSMVIHQDKIIPEEVNIPKINHHTDWERPEAIDWAKLQQLMETGINSGKTLIMEGLMAFSNPGINQLFSKTIFITLGKQEFVHRKKRDFRWGAEPDWYIEHIWNSYLKYGQLPPEFSETLILNGEANFNLEHIFNFLTE